MKSLFRYFLVAVVFSLFGFYTSSFSYFKFNEEINLVDFAALLISSILGLYIATTLQKKASDDKFEKDLLLNEISQIRIDFKQIYSSVLSENIEFNQTVFLFKTISSNLSMVDELFGKYNLKNNQNLRLITLQVRKIKRIVTGASPNGNLLILSVVDKNSFLVEAKKLNILFFDLIKEVNRK